jgi:hypothetical protein
VRAEGEKIHTTRGGEVRFVVWYLVVVARAAVRECKLGLFRLFDIAQARAGWLTEVRDDAR